MATTDRATPTPISAPKPKAAPRDGFFNEIGELVVFSGRALVALAGTPRYFSEALRVGAGMIRRTSFLLLAMNVFLGFSVASFGFFFLRTIGAGDFVGVFTGLLTQRQTSMTMYGYVLAASICCAITAEIGAARIQQEIDAYESTGVDPMQYIVGPRILGGLLFVPAAAIISLLGQNLGNFLEVVVVLQGNGARQFLDVTFSVQSVLGHLYAFITFAWVTVPCLIVACFYGMRASGGSVGVGAAVAKALMINLVLVHVITAFSGVFFYGPGNLDLPIV